MSALAQDMGEDGTQERKPFVDFLSLAMAVTPLLVIAFDAWGILYYRQGRRNEMMSFGPGGLSVALVLSFAIAGLLMRGYALTKARDSRVTFCWLLVPFVAMVWPALCAMRPQPIEIYRRGLADWARANVDVKAIRAWDASLPQVESTVRLPTNTAMPPEVQKLDPMRIERNAHGIILQWGTEAFMPGRTRKLFVASERSLQPPDEGRRFWVEVEPGVYVGAHGS